jgi:hypothetical protein
MSGLNSLLDHYDDQIPLQDLSLDEGQAIFDLLLLTVMIDGEITDEELESVTAESEKFPFGSAEDFAELVEEHAFRTRAELEEILDDEDAIAAFIADRAELIEGDEKRREALKMIAVVAYSDGVDSTEEDLCHQIGRHFGFSDEDIEAKLLAGVLSQLGL